MFLVHKLNKINLFSNSPPSIIYNKDNKIIINKIYQYNQPNNNQMNFKISKALNNNQMHNKNPNLKILNLI